MNKKVLRGFPHFLYCRTKQLIHFRSKLRWFFWQESPICPDILNSFLNGGVLVVSLHVGMFVFNLMADFCSTCSVFMSLCCPLFASSASSLASKYFVMTCVNARCPYSLFWAKKLLFSPLFVSLLQFQTFQQCSLSRWDHEITLRSRWDWCTVLTHKLNNTFPCKLVSISVFFSWAHGISWFHYMYSGAGHSLLHATSSFFYHATQWNSQCTWDNRFWRVLVLSHKNQSLKNYLTLCVKKGVLCAFQES